MEYIVQLTVQSIMNNSNNFAPLSLSPIHQLEWYGNRRYTLKPHFISVVLVSEAKCRKRSYQDKFPSSKVITVTSMQCTKHVSFKCTSRMKVKANWNREREKTESARLGISSLIRREIINPCSWSLTNFLECLSVSG